MPSTLSEPAIDALPLPHGGRLCNPMADPERREELRRISRDLTSCQLSERNIYDLELLLCGAFSPLEGFLGQADFDSVCDNMRLADGTLWPLPVCLDVDENVAETLRAETSSSDGKPMLVLRDVEGNPRAVLHVDEVYDVDRQAQARAMYGTDDAHHPGVAQVLSLSGRPNVGGRLEGITRPARYGAEDLRLDPAAARARWTELGLKRIVAFQTRNPLHRAHFEITRRAARDTDAHLLIHPVVGPTRPGDIDPFTRIRCYRAVLERYPAGEASLALLPLAMRMAGPREAVFHAIIRKNYGCTHFIVGRDHAGPGKDAEGRPYHGPYDAQELMAEHAEELGIEQVTMKEWTYVPGRDAHLPVDEVEEGEETLFISGSELRRRLRSGEELPHWLTFPEVDRELRRTYRPPQAQGFTVFFTGLSGAGKSTVAKALAAALQEQGDRLVTVLDGDVVRNNLTSELGFSKAHRDLNIQRIGWVAQEITRHGGAAICAAIAPYDEARRKVRSMVAPVGGFCLVHVATPLEVCEARDAKGLYAKARAGIIKEFTGISDPYEAPDDADLVIDTSRLSPSESAREIVNFLAQGGFFSPADVQS